MKFLIDEDLSPYIARYLCQHFLIDAIAIRDRGLLGVSDAKVLDYAFNEDRILVTANVVDFEKFAKIAEVHGGIVFIQEGDLLREEQIQLIQEVIIIIQQEYEIGQDMINRVLYISIDGTKRLETLP